MVAGRGNALRDRVGLGLDGPLDSVLDHPTLERVASDTEQLCGINDASGAAEGLLAQQSLGFAEIQVFQEDRHGQEDR